MNDTQSTEIMELPNVQLVKIEEIQPYFRNPRIIPQKAIDAVAQSIKDYRYQQPIVVDEDFVIIVGHTRLQALQQLGVKEVPVYVSNLPEDKAKEYRLVDNRTAELSGWDMESLVVELREWETSLLENYFPEVDLHIDQIEDEQITLQETADAVTKVSQIPEGQTMATTKVECPACYSHFDVRTDSLPDISADNLR